MDNDSKVIEFPEKDNRMRGKKRPASSRAILARRLELDREKLPDEIRKTISFLDSVEWIPCGVLERVGRETLAMYPLDEEGTLFLASNGKFYFRSQTILDKFRSLFVLHHGFYYFHWTMYSANNVGNPTEILESLFYIREY